MQPYKNVTKLFAWLKVPQSASYIIAALCCDLEKCLENGACLRTEIFLWKQTLSSTLNPNPKGSNSV